MMDDAQRFLLAGMAVVTAATLVLCYLIVSAQYEFEARCLQAGGAPKSGICLHKDALVEVDK